MEGWIGMLVFVDEAGDTGLKLDKGSSRFFIITAVIYITSFFGLFVKENQ